MEPRYLRQIGTTKPPFPYTDALARRKDMVPYNPEEAQARIEANQRIVEQMKEGKKIDPEAKAAAKAQAKELHNAVKELAASEKEIETLKFSIDEAPANEEPSNIQSKRDRQINYDRELKKIREMTRKAHVEEYLESKYGRKLAEDDVAAMSLKDIKDIAIKARIGTLYEVPDDKLK